MPIASYKEYFDKNVRGRADAILHSANIFPNDYAVVRAVTHSRTEDSLTVHHRLIPSGQSFTRNRLAFWIATDWPFGELLQRHVMDPIYFSGREVIWLNYATSRDVAELEPSSRASSTYLLQEFFVPVDRFDDFVPLLRNTLRTHHVNVVNISIRHATADPGTLLAWARNEVFAFVIYYKQQSTQDAGRAAEVWTRELIEAALSVGGSYYLPYQLHATIEQFRRAYPRADEFIALKQKLDPRNRFRNRFVDRYLARNCRVGC
jgi:FAD/FMN-containing dehydrogenase